MPALAVCRCVLYLLSTGHASSRLTDDGGLPFLRRQFRDRPFPSGNARVLRRQAENLPDAHAIEIPTTEGGEEEWW